MIFFRLALVLVFILQAYPVQALGIALRFVDVTLENVPVGASVNLRVLKNLPLVVQNLDSEEGTDIAIESVLPTSREMKEGYEPIPDPSWIKILPDRFHLGPRASAASDLLITIPNDPKLNGRHFECILWAHTEKRNAVIQGGGVVLQTGLRSRLRISIGTMGPAALQMEKAMKKLAEINVNFTISPNNLFANEVVPGSRVDLKKSNKVALRVINEADNPVELKIAPIAQEANITPQAGYEFAPDPKWLKIEQEKIKVEGISIKELKLFVTIPDKPEHKGKKYMFLVKTTLSDETLPLAYYNMVYVTVAAK